MSRIIPIPTSRVGDLFVRQRLTEQVQLDQLALFRLQTQVSTGQRLQVPSEDSAAALRIINVQRLLDRKGQIHTNLQSSNSYLSAAWERLGSVTSALSDLRGDVVGVMGTVVPDSARQAVVQQINSLLQELTNAGNAKFQGRHLFAGSRSQSQPYNFNGQYVEYTGNEGVLRSYVDLEWLFDTNLAGTDVFGGISAAVEGTEDLDPHVSAQTLVGSINHGTGLGSNPAIAISINTGTNQTSIVDLRSAVTLGDVARLIEAGAPAGTNVTVEVTSQGLELRTSSGTIRVAEAAQGQTARQLGILSDPNAAASNTIVGDDLNPAVLKTTRLNDLLGTKAQVRIDPPGANNSLVITAARNGEEFKDVTIVFATGGVPGSVNYDALAKTLTVEVDAQTTANDIATAITAEGTFTASVDYHDATSSAQKGTGIVPASANAGVTTGGSGETLDTTSGLILTNGGQSVTLDITDAVTVEDLLNLINGSGLGLRAEINASATGINVRSQLSGADFTIGENGGTTATQLGIRTFTGDTKLAALNRGLGVPTANNPANDDLRIIARDGTTFTVNLSAATTVEHVINAINSAATGAGANVAASLAATGNGIELVDSSVGAGQVTVQAVEGSQAAEYLGFLSAGQTVASGTTVGGNSVLQSADRHTLETDSVFNTLLRLRTALEQNDQVEIGRALERLDTDIDRVSFARGELGVRLQSLELIGIRLEDEGVQLQAALSEDADVDLVRAISDLTARQFAFEASLRTTAGIMQLSLLDFI